MKSRKNLMKLTENLSKGKLKTHLLLYQVDRQIREYNK